MNEIEICFAVLLLFGLLVSVRLFRLQIKILHKQTIIMNELQILKDAVTKELTIGQSVITFMHGLKVALDNAIASGDPKALTDLSSQLTSNSDALAAAIVANTPVVADPGTAAETPVVTIATVTAAQIQASANNLEATKNAAAQAVSDAEAAHAALVATVQPAVQQ